MALVHRRRDLKLKLQLSHHRTLSAPYPPLSVPKPSLCRRTAEVDALSDLETLSTLGHGNGGTVYKARHRRTSAVYALKLLRPSTANADIRRQISREMEILACTDSPRVVRCHGIFNKDEAGDVALVLEYMDCGTLDSVLRHKGSFSEDALARVAKQLVEGLHYLHGQKIVHRDIKPSNLLVNSKMEVKIADFGVSVIMSHKLETCTDYVGTNAYLSPERFDPQTYGGSYDGYAGDIWSLGITLWELLVGHFPLLPPGKRPDWASLMCAICFGEMPSFPEAASEELKSFLSSCLQKEASRRSTASELLVHPFLAMDRTTQTVST